jgi:hypothetical protein
MTTLYFEAPQTVIRAVKAKGFAAALGGDAPLCCDRSQADIPALPEVTDTFEELTLETAADVGEYECFPMDMPPGRWFEIPVDVLDKMTTAR